MDGIKKKFLEILDNSRGIITTACKSMNGMSRQTYYNWLKEDEEFKQACEDIQENAIDFVEGKLMEKINGITMLDHVEDDEEVTYKLPPSDTAIIFYLKTKGKKRGYVERMEVDNMGSLSIMTLDPLNATSTNDSTTEDSGS